MSDQQPEFGRSVRFPGPKNQKQHLSLTKKQMALAVATLLVLAVAAWAIVASILPTEGMKEDAVLQACKEDALSQLRDPESARFELPETPERPKTKSGDEGYFYDGAVRSRNGFGGMTSTPMVCIGSWDDEAGEPDMKAVLLDLN